MIVKREIVVGLIIGIFLVISEANATYITPISDMIINSDATIYPDAYDLPDSISMGADNRVQYYNDSTIIGTGTESSTDLSERSRITAKNSDTGNYQHRTFRATSPDYNIQTSNPQNSNVRDRINGIVHSDTSNNVLTSYKANSNEYEYEVYMDASQENTQTVDNEYGSISKEVSNHNTVLSELPDLAFSCEEVHYPDGIQITPVDPEIGDTVKINVWVNNTGEEDVIEEFNVTFYLGDPDLNNDGVIDETASNIGSKLIEGGLFSGRSAVSTWIEWIPEKAGTFSIYAVIDPENNTDHPKKGSVIECNESNNTVHREIYISDRYALLVFVTKDLNDEAIHAGNIQLEAIKQLLIEGYSYDKDNIVVLKDGEATFNNIKKEYIEFRDNKSNSGKNKLFYWHLGHGIALPQYPVFNFLNKEGIATDTKPFWDHYAFPPFHSRDESLSTYFNEIDNITIVFETCHSGGLSLETDETKAFESSDPFKWSLYDWGGIKYGSIDWSDNGIPTRINDKGQNKLILMAVNSWGNAGLVADENFAGGIFTKYWIEAFTHNRDSDSITKDNNSRVSHTEAFEYAYDKCTNSWWYRDEQNGAEPKKYQPNTEMGFYFSNNMINTPYWTVRISNPVTLRAFDNEGRHTGMTVSGEVEYDIPHSSYIPYSDEELMIVYDPSTLENVKFEMEALKEGEFTIELKQFVDERIISKTFIDIPVTAVSIGYIEMSHDRIADTLELDHDGDGVIDMYIGSGGPQTTDNDKTVVTHNKTSSIPQPKGTVEVAVMPQNTGVSPGNTINYIADIKNKENIDDLFNIHISFDGIPSDQQIHSTWFDRLSTTKMVPTGAEAKIQFNVTVPLDAESGTKMFKVAAESVNLTSTASSDIVNIEIIKDTVQHYDISFLPPITIMDQYSLTNGSTLPIKFTVRDYDTGEFVYDDTVNVTITDSKGHLLTYYTNGNVKDGVRINNKEGQYIANFHSKQFELKVGETYIINVIFGEPDDLKGLAIAHFTLVDKGKDKGK